MKRQHFPKQALLFYHLSYQRLLYLHLSMTAFLLTNADRARAQALLSHALKFNQQQRPAGTLDLWLNEHRIGLISEKTASEVCCGPLNFLFSRAPQGIVFAPKSSFNDDLALAAGVFHKSGFFFQWRNELLDVRDLDTGLVLAQAERGLFRYFGMATHCVYAVGYTKDGRIFMSQRSLSKQVDPGLWDTLAAGLMAAGESPQESLAREIAEEAGLFSGDYAAHGLLRQFSIRRPVEEGWMHEDAICQNIVVHSIENVHNTDGEVAAIELADPEKLLDRIAAGMVPWDSAVAFLTSLV